MKILEIKNPLCVNIPLKNVIQDFKHFNLFKDTNKMHEFKIHTILKYKKVKK